MMCSRGVVFRVFQASLSLPPSPFQLRRGSRVSQFSWRRKTGYSPRAADRQPLVLPYLMNLELPFADDSAAVTPTSEELCNWQNTQSFLAKKVSNSHVVRQRRANTRLLCPQKRVSVGVSPPRN